MKYSGRLVEVGGGSVAAQEAGVEAPESSLAATSTRVTHQPPQHLQGLSQITTDRWMDATKFGSQFRDYLDGKNINMKREN